MFNRYIDKRAANGLKLFAILSILIILIGLIMHVTESFATGRYDTRLSKGYNASLGGKQVILLGFIMIALDIYLYFACSEKKNPEEIEY